MTTSYSRHGNVVALCAWLIGFAYAALFVTGDADAYSDVVAQTRALGYASFLLLSAALCVSPLARWVRESAKLRRALGLAAAAMTWIHVMIAATSSPLTLSDQLADPHLRFGFGGFAVLCVLAITSFPRVVGWLKLRSWKELHRLAYVAWICALLHGLLSPYAWLRALCSIAASVLIVGLLRLLPRRSRR